MSPGRTLFTGHLVGMRKFNHHEIDFEVNHCDEAPFQHRFVYVNNGVSATQFFKMECVEEISMYATQSQFAIIDRWTNKCIKVSVQAVPSFIGAEYNGDPDDPYADIFYPPALNEEEEEKRPCRAIVFAHQYDKKERQRYLDPILIMSWEEYRDTPFVELMGRVYAGFQQTKLQQQLKEEYERERQGREEGRARC